jgi:hypothetical protein
MKEATGANITTKFADVKKVLDDIIAGWKTGNGGAPDLTGKHGASFLLDTRDHLLAAEALGNRLIQPDVIGKPEMGKTANIVVALTNPNGVNGFGQMPLGGLDSVNGQFLSLDSPQVQTIIAWIEDGCLP